MPFTVRQLPTDLVLAAAYGSRAEARQHTAVLLAKQIECWSHTAPGQVGHGLWVRPEKLDMAQRELTLFDTEQETQASLPPPEPLPSYSSGKAWLIGVAAVLIGVFYIQHEYTFKLQELWQRNSEAILHKHQYWRLFTAMLLHADLPHLVMNLFFLGVFGTWCARTFKPWKAWLLVALSGIIANFICAAMWLGFNSLGASTAVFAMVGLLTGWGVDHAMRSRDRSSHRNWLMPFGGGLALLATFGASESRHVDLAAHLFGFVAGLPIGWLTGRFWR